MSSCVSHEQMSLLGTHSSKLKEQARAFHTALEQYPEPQQALLASSHPANPLLVQEKVFSKYAALVSTAVHVVIERWLAPCRSAHHQTVERTSTL